MTSKNEKLRSLFLTALMVSSVVAGSIVLSGAAAAANERGTSGMYNVSESNGTVGPDATIFQGEEDITIVDSSNSSLDAVSFERTSGANEGETLEIPVPEDQPTGTYNNSEQSLTVQTPRVQNLDILNPNDQDISGGTISGNANVAMVVAEYNFNSAEELELTVEDESGLEVTQQALDGNDSTNSSSISEFGLNLNQLESGEEYTVTVEGEDDLNFGAATQSTTFQISSDDSPTLTLDQEEATQGEDVRYELTGADEGDVHPVLISGNDVTNTGDVAQIFRNVGDTVDRGNVSGDAVALVEIDDGVGVGQIETADLDDTSVDVTLYESVDVTDVSGLDATNNLSSDVEVDDETLDVTEGDIQLDNPTGSYVVNTQVDINGSTTAGVDEVGLYARDEGDFELITTIEVDGDDTFEEEDFNLANEGLSNLLSLPGTYRLALVDTSSTSAQFNNGTLREDLTTSQVSSAVSYQSSLRVIDANLTVDYVSIINGQVAEGDSLTVQGTAPGQDSVGISFYGPRGTYDRYSASVDDDDTFDEDNVPVGNAQFGNQIDQGNVVMSVFSSGRDGVVGDGDFPGGAATSIQFLQNISNDDTLSQQQLIDRISAETTEDTGSDDISEVFQFRHTDPQTSINNVDVSNGELTIEGVTNRQPDDTEVTVEVIEGPSSNQMDLVSTDQWGTDGQWNVTIDVSGADTGNYTVEADDGDNSDIASFQLTEDGLQQEPTDTPDEPDTDTPDQDPDTDTPDQDPDTDTPDQDPDTDTPDQDTEAETTTADGPGFTAVLALVALVAAALLAVRRRD